MNPVQYIILSKKVPMSTGKAAAQAAHASVQGLYVAHGEHGNRNPWDASIVNRWMRGGHYAKVVLEADDVTVAERYINDRGFATALIIDEGRTEVDPLTPTALGTGVVDKDQPHVRETFGEFKLYTDPVEIIDVVGMAREAGWRPPSTRKPLGKRTPPSWVDEEIKKALPSRWEVFWAGFADGMRGGRRE